MKNQLFPIIVITVLIPFITNGLLSQKYMPILEFTMEINKAVPEGFKMDESGIEDKNNYAVYKKSPQEVITFNLQKDYQIDFQEQEESKIKDHNTIFYYAGTEKSANIVVFLKNDAGYIIIGYNKPYTGDEIVEKEELTDIVKKLDLSKFE